MANITYRLVKGSPLSMQEHDDNLTALQQLIDSKTLASLQGILSIAKGGTGAATAVESCAALGAFASKVVIVPTGQVGLTIGAVDRGTVFVIMEPNCSVTVASSVGLNAAILNLSGGHITVSPASGNTLNGTTDSTSIAQLASCIVVAGSATSSFLLSFSGSSTPANPQPKYWFENPTVITENVSVTAGKNAVSAGPITVAPGVTVTVPPGSHWSVT